MEYAREGTVKEGTLLVTDYQTAGRGQRGNQWQSAPGENLLFSLYLSPTFLSVQKQYVLNLLTSLAMVGAIETLATVSARLEIKWPNDLYMNDKKLAGILVETQLKGRQLEHVVIGVGLNFLQRSFEGLNATSLAAEGMTPDRWELLEVFAQNFEHHLTHLKEQGELALREQYLQYLRWLNEKRQFEDAGTAKQFEGRITGIDEFGRLTMRCGSHDRIFDIQQLKFIA